jgi:hypothetical protein
MLLARCGCDPVKRGRGRPPIYGVAMTPAEQKRQKRAEQRATKAKQERRELLAKLLVAYRRMQPIPYLNPNSKVTDPAETLAKIEKNIREQQHRFFDELENLETWRLKYLLDCWTKTPDSHGGSEERTTGTGNIALIADLQQMREEKGYGGVGAERFKPVRQLSAFDNRLYLVARWLMRKGVCPVCGFVGNEEHIWSEWYKADYIERWTGAAKISQGMASVMMGFQIQIDWGHWNAVKKYRTKPLAFFRSVDDRNPYFAGTKIEIEDSVKRGWAFFSTRVDRTEHLLPSQAVVKVFFGHLRFGGGFDSKSLYIKLVQPTEGTKTT